MMRKIIDDDNVDNKEFNGAALTDILFAETDVRVQKSCHNVC